MSYGQVTLKMLFLNKFLMLIYNYLMILNAHVVFFPIVPLIADPLICLFYFGLIITLCRTLEKENKPLLL